MPQIIDISKLTLSDWSKIQLPMNFRDNSGFSLRIHYPNQFCDKIRFRENLFTLVRFIIDDSLPSTHPNLKRIIIAVDLYIEDAPGSHFLSREFKKYTDEIYPINIEILDEISYDFYEEVFYIHNDKILFENLLDYIIKLHTKNTLPFKGCYLRFKSDFFRFLSNAFALFHKISDKILVLFFGEKVDIDYKNYYFDDKPKESLKNITSELQNKVSFGSYETNFPTLISFSILAVAFFIGIYENESNNGKLIKKISENNFFSIPFGILLLFLYDFIVRRIIKKANEFFASASFYFKYKKIKL